MPIKASFSSPVRAWTPSPSSSRTTPWRCSKPSLPAATPASWPRQRRAAYLFIASTNGSDVSILDIDTRKLMGVVDVGGQSDFIAITPDNRFALALNKTAGTMAVVNIPAYPCHPRQKRRVVFHASGRWCETTVTPQSSPAPNVLKRPKASLPKSPYTHSSSALQ